jgi:3-hydroxybutyryl-CoA dehydrogenase
MEQTIGVIGAGTMGVGVSHAFAIAGYKVVLVDIYEETLEKAKQNIKKNMRFQKFFFKDIEKKDFLDNIEFSTSIHTLRDCSMVIENVTENWDIKTEVYKALDEICLEGTIFGVNTSAIPITKVASLTNRPSKVIGVHFMNPVPIMPVVEVIRGYHTSEETVNYMDNILKSIGKDCKIVNDSPGFITNRAMMIFVNEAVFCLYENITDKESIDSLFKTCFGHKMGPLQTADLIGLDTILYSLNVLYEEFNDPKYRPCPLLKKMVAAGLLGVKSGQGFYQYHIE